jgi:hypothetical protein
MVHPYRSVIGIGLLASLFASMSALAGDSPMAAGQDPMSPAAFFPGGMLGVDLGSPWGTIQKSPLATFTRELERTPKCSTKYASSRPEPRRAPTSHDGFIVRKAMRHFDRPGITIRTRTIRWRKR